MTLKNYIYNNVKMGSKVYTDDNMGYRKMQPAYKHNAVTHSIGQYAKKDLDGSSINTNSIESFWSMLKRGYIGVYHFWSRKHLQKYLNEYMFRHNFRENQFSICFTCFDKKTPTIMELTSE